MLCDKTTLLLTTGKFGSNSAIIQTAKTYYAGTARILSEHLGIDNQLLLRSASPQIESLRRAHLDQALKLAQAGDRISAKKTLEDYSYFLEELNSHEPDIQLWEAAEVLQIPHDWTRNRVSKKVLSAFSEGMEKNPDGSKVVAAKITPHTRKLLQQSVDFLYKTVPAIASDVLIGIPQVALFNGALLSGYSSAVPLLIFINEDVLGDPVKAAELILHESLHQKLNDICITRTILKIDYKDSESATITVPWGSTGNQPREFSIDRCLAAFHVYTHQTVFYLSMLMALGDDQSIQIRNSLVSSWSRADHFSQAAKTPEFKKELGAEGLELISWLSACVDDLGNVDFGGGSLRYCAESLSS
ncbi:hypothetical protein AOZ07_01505 [Glutamicibacter halophytocola]|nr:hypothetical protein AOZ07_01505 [Glutamicibacter halophytocola]